MHPQDTQTQIEGTGGQKRQWCPKDVSPPKTEPTIITAVTETDPSVNVAPSEASQSSANKTFSRELVLLTANALKTVELDGGREYRVLATEVYYPSLFWLQLQDIEAELDRLMAEIK